MSIKISTPFTNEVIEILRAGDQISLSGTIYTGRDAAHKRMVEDLSGGLPFNPEGVAIFYAGPCPARPGQVIGSIGPTTSGRMDAYSPALIEHGLKVMIGKGARNREVIESIVKHKGLYLTAIGGAAALMARCVTSSEIVAYPELGTEAVRRLEVCDMPLFVAIDSYGRSIF